MKEGDHEIANNNHPVSRLPVASKVWERVALNQLATYMNKTGTSLNIKVAIKNTLMRNTKRYDDG